MKRSRTQRVPMPAVAALGAAALFGPTGCFTSNDGPSPPASEFYFPTALVVSPRGSALYVVNSNFDLQYTGGTVQALDLAKLREVVPKLWCRVDAAGQPDPSQPECAPFYDPEARVDPNDPTSPRDPFPCKSFGLAKQGDNEQLSSPGRCSPIDLNIARADGQPILRNTVTLGAFASGALVLSAPPEAMAAAPPGESTARLGVVVRGDPSLTWIELDDDRVEGQGFRLECGQGTGTGRCDAAHLAGKDPTTSTRAITLPNEPFAISSTDAGDALAVTHQAGGVVSLFVQGWRGSGQASCAAQYPDRPELACTGASPDRPELAFVLGGLQGRATSVVGLPVPRFVREARAACDLTYASYRPSFLVTYRDLPQVDRLVYFDDCASSPDRPFLGFGGTTSIGLSASGFDSRGIAIDPSARRAAEAACDAADRDCLLSAAAVPVKVYVASRAPSSLLIGETATDVTAAGSTDLVRFYDMVSLSPGVSGVQVGAIIDTAGQRRTRVFITCFDTRFIYVYDPERNAVEGIVRTGRGPNSIAFDPSLDEASGIPVDEPGAAPRAFAYVGHFTDSYVGVLDLDQRHASTYLTIVASVGSPRAPRDSRLRHGPPPRPRHPRRPLSLACCHRGPARLRPAPAAGPPALTRPLGPRLARLHRRPARQHGHPGPPHARVRQHGRRWHRRLHLPVQRERPGHQRRAPRLRARHAADAR